MVFCDDTNHFCVHDLSTNLNLNAEMEMQDDYGHAIFESIKITLVCDECMKTDHRAHCY